MTSTTACDEITTASQESTEAILTDDQTSALREIEASEHPGETFLLTGNAGTGKTFLMQRLARNALERKKKIVLSAPTHKAVAALARKMTEADLDVPCITVHRLLSLKPKPYGDRLVFERAKYAEPITADIVVIDECSMVDADLLRHIKRYLPMAFVIFLGDPAQLPPVGEVASQTFDTKRRAHLTAIVRQAAGNPIIEAAGVIRRSQGSAPDWSWCQPRSLDSGHGIFVPRDHRQWMQKAFTSDEFEGDPDSFRYLAWTNARVHEVNTMIRHWRYGENIPTPFMPGERAIFRSPLFIDDTLLFATNEEATVLSIERETFTHKVPEAFGVPSWTAAIASWRIKLRKTDGGEHSVHMPQNDRDFERAQNRTKDEAADARVRWKHLHEFKSSMARLQSIYCMTIHTSQGSTLGTAFVDIADIRRRERDNPLETLQLAYVAATRASKRLVLVGV